MENRSKPPENAKKRTNSDNSEHLTNDPPSDQTQTQDGQHDRNVTEIIQKFEQIAKNRNIALPPIINKPLRSISLIDRVVADEDEEIPKQRGGFINLGIEYENGISGTMAIRSATQEDIQDFTLKTNVQGFGKLDDIYLTVTLKNEEKYLLLFQIKHKHGKTLEYNNVFEEKEGMFYLEDLKKSYKSIKNKSPNINLILFTNAAIAQNEKLIQYESNGWLLSLLNTKEDGVIYTIQCEENHKDFDFLSKVLVVTNQIHAQNLEIFLKADIKKLFNQDDDVIDPKSVQDILAYFKYLNRIDVSIDRENVRQILFDYLLAPKLFERDVGDVKSNHSNLIIKTFTQYHLSFVSTSHADYLAAAVYSIIEQNDEFIGKAFNNAWLKKVNLRNKIEDTDSFFIYYKLSEDIIGRDFYLMLCRQLEVPMMLEYNTRNKKLIDSTLNTLHDMVQYRRVVLITDLEEAIEEARREIKFGSLLNVKEDNEALYYENIESVQIFFNNDSSISLREALEPNCENDILELINPNVYLEIITKGLNIHQSIDLIHYYIKRSIKLPILPENIQNKCTDTFQYFKAETDNYQDIIKMIENIKNTNVHIVEKISNETERVLQWHFTKGLIQKLTESQIQNDYSHQFSKREDQLFELLDNKNIQTISSNAGMGKTTLLVKLKEMEENNRHWSIFVNLAEHAHSFENVDESEYSKIILKILRFDNPHNVTILEQLFLQFFNNGKITWLVDGFNEVHLDKVKSFLNWIQQYQNKIIITTRSTKRNKIEEFFNILCLDLETFTENDRFEFLKKYQNLENDREIEKLLSRLSELDREIIGIPLQIQMCADIIKENKIDHEKFSLVYLFDKFIERGKINEDIEYRTNLSKLAFAHVFTNEILKDVGLYGKEVKEKVEAFKNSHKRDFIITGFNTQGEPIFTHSSYAEFLAAKGLQTYLEDEDSFEPYKKLYKKLFCKELTSTRLLFDKAVAEESNLDLHKAVLSNDLNQVKNVLQKNKDIINQKDKFGRTALHLAAGYGSLINTKTKKDVHGVKNAEECRYKEEEKNYEVGLSKKESAIINQDISNCLLQNGAKNCTDTLLEKDVIGYGLQSCSLENTNFLCSKLSPKPSSSNLSDVTIPVVTFASVQNRFGKLLEYILATPDIEFVSKTYNKRSLLCAAIENNENSDENQNQNEIELEQLEIVKLLTDFEQNEEYVEGLNSAQEYGKKNIVEYLKTFKKKGRNSAIYDDVDTDKYLYEDSSSPLQKAVKEGDLNTFNILLNQGESYNELDSTQRSLIHFASESNNTEILERVLKLDIDINSVDKYNQTSLHTAVAGQYLNSVDILLDKKIDVTKINYDGRNVLHYAAQVGNCKLIMKFLNLGIAIDCKDKLGSTPLHIAARYGQLEALNLLLTKGADCKVTDLKLRNLLHYAIESNSTPILGKVLDLGIPIDSVDKFNQTPLHIATGKGKLDSIKCLLDRKAKWEKKGWNGQTLLHYASENNNVEVIIDIFKLCTDVNIKDDDKRTPLHLAALFGNLNTLKFLLEQGGNPEERNSKEKNLIHFALESKNITVLEEVLALNIDINKPDINNSTPLHIAASKGYLDAFKILINKGANYNLLGFGKQSLLHYAVESNDEKMILEILQLGIDINITDEFGYTPLQTAVILGKLNALNILLRENADWRKLGDKGKNLLHFSVLGGNIAVLKKVLSLGIDIDDVDEDESSPLHSAASKGKLTAFNFLLHNDADSKKLGWNKQSLLHSAAESGNLEIMEKVLSLGVNINSLDADSNTALHTAAALEDTHSAKNSFDFLILKGIDRNIKNRWGKTALVK